MTGYINTLKLRLEDKETQDVAYADLEHVKYDQSTGDRFTQLQMHNEKGLVRRAALKTLIFERLALEILESMHTFDLTGKTDSGMIDIIT